MPRRPYHPLHRLDPTALSLPDYVGIHGSPGFWERWLCGFQGYRIARLGQKAAAFFLLPVPAALADSPLAYTNEFR